jgi:hypothetical protein
MISRMPLKNPFCPHEPIREPLYFFGRQYEVANILSHIRRGQCAAVLGNPKIGKTSLLYQLAHPTVLSEQGLSAEEYQFVYVNGTSLAYASRQQSFGYISERIKGHVERPSGGKVSFATRFTTLHRICRGLNRSGIKLVLVLDSLDSLGSNNQLGSLFFEPLRSLNAQYNALYVTGSERSLYEIESKAIGEHGSPFFSIFKEFELGPLSQSESLEMLHYYGRPIVAECPTDILALIAKRTAGYPYHLQSMGWRLVELLRDNGWQWSDGCNEALLEALDRLPVL